MRNFPLLHLRRVMLIICINSVLIFLIALVIKAMGDVLTVSAADEIYSPSRQNIGADDTLSLRSETGWTDLGDVVSPATVSYAIAQTPNGLLVGGTYDGGGHGFTFMIFLTDKSHLELPFQAAEDT